MKLKRPCKRKTGIGVLAAAGPARFGYQHQTFYFQPFLGFGGVGSFTFADAGRSFSHMFYYTLFWLL